MDLGLKRQSLWNRNFYSDIFREIQRTPRKTGYCAGWKAVLKTEKNLTVHISCFAGMALYAELPEAVHKSASGNRRSRNLLRWSLGAAAVVIALVSGYVGSRISLDALSGQMNTIASVGQQMMLTLPDGTKVQLNSGSSLEYPQVFDGKTRNVRLVGEALFDVTHNPEKPFIVETFASDIQVLGTNFNVIADKERNLFSATLISGSVKVTSRINPQESLIMLPNDVVMLVGDRLQKKQTDNFDDLCWTRGSIHIKKSSNIAVS